MGKISLPDKSKKADDVEGLMKLCEESPTPTKTAPRNIHPPNPQASSNQTKAGCCRRARLFSLSVSLIMMRPLEFSKSAIIRASLNLWISS